MSVGVFDDPGRFDVYALSAFINKIHELVLFVLVLETQSSYTFWCDLIQTRAFGRSHAVKEFVILELWESGVDVAPVSVETLRDVHTDITLAVAKSLQNLEVDRAFQLHYRVLGGSHPKVPLVSSNVISSVAIRRSYQRYL